MVQLTLRDPQLTCVVPFENNLCVTKDQSWSFLILRELTINLSESFTSLAFEKDVSSITYI